MENTLHDELGIDLGCVAKGQKGFRDGCRAVADLNKWLNAPESDVLSLIEAPAVVMFEWDLMHLLARHEYLARAQNRDPCEDKWVVVGDRFAESSYGWVFGPSMPASGREAINQVFRDLRADRSIDGLWQHWFNESSSCLADRAKDKTQLSLADFWGIFLILGVIGCGLVVGRVLQDFGLVPQGGATPTADGGDGLGFGDKKHYAESQYDMIRKMVRHQEVMLAAIRSRNALDHPLSVPPDASADAGAALKSVPVRRADRTGQVHAQVEAASKASGEWGGGGGA